jgi:long-chain acyl-CoA synthetase
MIAAALFTEFARSASAAGSRSALIGARRGFTYAQLYALALQRASDIAGQAPGAIALLHEDPSDLLTAFLAGAALGRPAMILDPALPPPRLLAQIERHPPACLAADARFAALAVSCPLLAAERPASPSMSLPAVNPEAEFYWGFTSGTTGEPKLFARSHRSWLESFRAQEALFPFPEASRILIPGPLSHSLFLYGAVHALCRGHAVIAPGPFRPDRALAALREASHAYLVPSMLADMLACGLKGLQPLVIFCGGAKLSQDLRRRCEAALPGADLVEFYGASETSFIACHSTSAPAPEGSVGRLFPGVAVEIRAADGASCTPPVEGEMYVNSRMMFSRYVGECAAPEWFAPGDIGYLDGGCLYLTGRKSRIIHSRALKIRPEPIEQALLACAGVRRAAVVDLPDPRRGAVVAAAIEREPGALVSRRDLAAQCRERLGARFSPRFYFEADGLPLTRSGKVSLATLRAALIARDPCYRELR